MNRDLWPARTPEDFVLLYLGYAFCLGILAYCVWGAATGELAVPGYKTIDVYRGRSAWLVSLAALLFTAEWAVRYDPRVRLRDNARKNLCFVLLGTIVALMIYALMFNPKA